MRTPSLAGRIKHPGHSARPSRRSGSWTPDLVVTQALADYRRELLAGRPVGVALSALNAALVES